MSFLVAAAFSIDVPFLDSIGLLFTVEIFSGNKWKQLTESSISLLYKKEQCRVRIVVKDLNDDPPKQPEEL